MTTSLKTISTTPLRKSSLPHNFQTSTYPLPNNFSKTTFMRTQEMIPRSATPPRKRGATLDSGSSSSSVSGMMIPRTNKKSNSLSVSSSTSSSLSSSADKSLAEALNSTYLTAEPATTPGPLQDDDLSSIRTGSTRDSYDSGFSQVVEELRENEGDDAVRVWGEDESGVGGGDGLVDKELVIEKKEKEVDHEPLLEYCERLAKYHMKLLQSAQRKKDKLDKERDHGNKTAGKSGVENMGRKHTIKGRY